MRKKQMDNMYSIANSLEERTESILRDVDALHDKVTHVILTLEHFDTLTLSVLTLGQHCRFDCRRD